MDISKPLNLVLTTILFLIFSNTSFCQKLEPKERVTEPDHTITSTIMGKEYQLHISFPANYSTKDTITYPVLYVLDGGDSFQAFQSAQKYLSIDDRIEDVIIVGINGKGRTYDYSPSVDTISEREIEEAFGLPKGTIKSGGANRFLNVIKTEIAPFVEKHYKTNGDKGITGHSLGGLFTAYCLINSDGYFNRFGINSPSLYWNKEELLNQAISEIENRYYNKIQWDIPPTKVFISVGGLEGSSMVPTMVKLSTYLEELDSDSIDLEWKIFENESHVSVIPANLSRTISVLYSKNY
tara:strand:+ start:2199 stop:3083 length:885 start_codon:yes stop_codon:yes gene_type:complete